MKDKILKRCSCIGWEIIWGFSDIGYFSKEMDLYSKKNLDIEYLGIKRNKWDLGVI